MAHRIIRDVGTSDIDTPSSSKIIQTQESNLDIIEYVASQNFEMNNLDTFDHLDFNNNKIFSGVVRQNENGDNDKLYGFDYGIELGEIRIRKNFVNITPLEIIEDVITNYTSLSYSNNGVVANRVIPLYPSQNKSASEIINDMHKLLGSTHVVDVDKVFIVEYEGSDFNPIILEVGVNCNTDATGWILDTSTLVKNIRVNGGQKLTTETVLLSGTGSQLEFDIPNPYLDITVEYPIGTELKPTLQDVQDGDYEIFKETAKIVFDTAPASGVNNILITYTYNLQANWSIQEVTQSETVLGTNPHEVSIQQDYLKEVLECKDYAEKYKSKFKNGTRDVTLIVVGVNLKQFMANQRVRVIDNIHKVNNNNIDDIFLIKRIERGFGNGQYFLLITVGDSRNFVYNQEYETEQRIKDFSETNPSAEIFNEGISMLADLELEIEYETQVTLFSASVPKDTLIYNYNRKYSTSNNVLKYKYINSNTYLRLFKEEK